MMPGYILHLTAAKMLLNMLEDVGDAPRRILVLKKILKDKNEKNAFLAGSLLPDSVSDKKYSHFRNQKYCEEMIEYPDLQLFLEKYSGLICESSGLGYYFHLYIDNRFFKDYLPKIILFENEKGEPVTKRGDVKWVRDKRDGKRILKEEFFSEKYYYGDYTRMNTYLVKRYELPVSLEMNVENPGIEEVDYSSLGKILEELKGYLCVPLDEVEKVRVFCVEELLEFLRDAVKEFLEGMEPFCEIIGLE